MPDDPLFFDDLVAREDLVEWSRRYCDHAVRRHDLDVDLARVDWTVSTRAKRRAAAVERPRLQDAVVGEPYDWAGSELPDGGASDGDGGGEDGPPQCTMSLTWAAFEAFDRAEWTAVLRHELVHVEQFQRFGTTDHGRRFRRRARAVDATLECRTFATPKYRLHCDDCGGVVARRYRDCDLVRNHRRYASNCCRANLRIEQPCEE